VHNQPTGRDVIKQLLDVDYDVVHVQYDNKMFATNDSDYEQLENLVWFIEYNQLLGKRVAITLHGIPHYDNPPKANWAAKLTWKLLRRAFSSCVIPALNTCEVIVHTHHDKQQLLKLGVEHAHVVEPPAIVSADNTVLRDLRNDRFKIVIPGQRSRYKMYDQIIKMLTHLPDHVELYISDDRSVFDGGINNSIMTNEQLSRVNMYTFSADKETYLQQLKSFDLAVLPYSENVASSGSLQDCLHAGLPCITTPTRNFVEFENKYGCIIVPEPFLTATPVYINRCMKDAAYVDRLVDNIHNYQAANTYSEVESKMNNVFEPQFNINQLKDIPDRVINIFMCCRDNEDSLPITLMNLQHAQRGLDINRDETIYRYYIYENDSVDNTVGVIEELYKQVPGKWRSEKLSTIKWPSDPGVGRMRDMARYRNTMKALCDDWSDSHYSFILDSEIEFSPGIMSQQIKYLEQNPDVMMLTPYGTVGGSSVYYDQFAYRDKNNSNDITAVDDRVNSAFAGFVCIRTPILERCRWDVIDGDTSEHIPFCSMVRRYGEVAIDKNVIVRW
jgi:hypothetical protein